ncbi:MAG: hypothetical protein D3M94_00800 [Rhodocyclales bacterium GT-UBC]|nr:MAG: hypothetical protein D3M94_00800 [Rhodocyclales bacterium GT-UBC]
MCGRSAPARYAVALALSLSAAMAGATPIGDALDRPAVASRIAQHAAMLGVAEAGDRLVAVGERGIVLLSDDAGTHWRQVPAPVSVTLTAVRFADAKHGYAVGHGATVLTTADGGETWVRRLDGRQAAQTVLAGVLNGGDAAQKREAERLVADGPDKPLLDVLVQDARHAIVVGAYGLAFATADGGRTWSSWAAALANPKGLHLYAIRQRGDRVLVVGEQGLVRLSMDGGQRFAPLVTPYAGSFFTAELPSGNEIVLAGLRGNVWRSPDGGANWVRLAVPMPASITASAVRADGSLLLANQAGVVLGERGGALAPVNAQPFPPLSGILSRRDGKLVALGIHGAMVVPDGDPK